MFHLIWPDLAPFKKIKIMDSLTSVCPSLAGLPTVDGVTLTELCRMQVNTLIHTPVMSFQG